VSLAQLTIRNLRRLAEADVELHAGRNLIFGSNGSGKTSFLEAIYLLGRGRSFRTRNTERVIRHGEHDLVVFGRTGSDPPRLLGIQASRGTPTVAKIDGAFAASLAELSQALPVQVIEPGVHKLVEESAMRRRRWLDWGVFHVEPGFIDTWSRYVRVLKQRNAALRMQPEQAGLWDAQLIEQGEVLDRSRGAFIQRLQVPWQESIAALLDEPVELTYASGWGRHESLAAALRSAAERDRARGLTHAGPHRGDVILRIGGRVAREVLSRGQQKLVAAAMILAQLKVLAGMLGSEPVLLLDDPAAELDEARLQAFVAQIEQLRCQLVVTSLSPERAPFGRFEGVFHVEQGGVRPV
jgi:DNA replication and repair protein RecF